MNNVLISLFVILVFLLIHLFLHARYPAFRSLKRIVFFYGIGALVVLVGFMILPSSEMTLPITALMIYVLLSMLLFIFYYSLIVLNGVPPSSAIVGMFKSKPILTEDTIINSISRTVIYDRRIENMISDGWITKKNGRYNVAPKGRIIMTCIGIYERIFGWRIGG